VVDSAGDQVIEDPSSGVDTVLSSISYTLGSNVENLTLTGTAAINGTGTGLANTITGNVGDNVLTGAAGADTLYGGTGNDTLVGNDGIDALYGGDGHDTLDGAAGADTLDGGVGADTMIGGINNDTYFVDDAGDVVVEDAYGGSDTVQASVSYTLAANVETLTLTGTAAINGTGNGTANIIAGNPGDNVLDGGDYADTLYGDGGNDTLIGGQGVDSLFGGDGDDVLDGGADADRLDGGAGNDIMSGGTHNDTYVVDSTGDVVIEAASEGSDVVESSISYTLGNNVEHLFLTGSNAINGTDNALSNLLRGNAAVNTLIGTTGKEILEGGAGDDILSDSSGNGVQNGGAGNDSLAGSGARDLFIGGTGNDAVTTGAGADLILFNKGDGSDTVGVSTTRDNVLSLGGGTTYADLLFQKSGNNLILKVGATDQITFTNYYANANNHSIDRLQVVIEGTSDHVAGSSDVTRDNKVETFNFEGLVAAFDAARVADPLLTTWALTNALTTQYLSGSDTAAIGGDLAYQYHRTGSLSDISFNPALTILGDAAFVTGAQTLQGTGNLQDSTPRLS
jgi:trimeric autotransporter adhesin